MTPDLLGAIFTPTCIGCGKPATVDDTPFKLCADCDERLTESLRASGFPMVTPANGSVQA